jgi:DNA-binding IscR family transcriptional regulator
MGPSTASEVTLLEVIEAVEGPIRGDAPRPRVERPGPAGGLDQRLQAVCDQAAAQLRKQLGKVRLSDLPG